MDEYSYPYPVGDAGREQVRLAALYLDGVKPDWWQHIDPLKLNLRSECSCVCGQNGLEWGSHAAALYVKHPRIPAGSFAARKFEPFWLEEIAQRMPSPVREPVRASAVSPRGASVS